MAAHSQLGASSAHRWFECPASIPLSVDKERQSSVYAMEGTAAHNVAELILTGMATPDSLVDTYMDIDGTDILITQEMLDAVKVYTDYVEQYKDEALEYNIEHKFQLKWIDEELFGTNDASVALIDGKVIVVDFKYGQGIPVEAEENEQLLYYALGAAKKYPGYDLELVIIQPRSFHPAGAIRKWSVPYSKLEEFEGVLRGKVIRVQAARAKFEASGAEGLDGFYSAGGHCKFCPAAKECLNLRNEAINAAQMDFNDVTVLPPPPATLNNGQISVALSMVDIMEQWITSVREHAYDLLSKGETVPGYKLVQKYGNRKWKDEEAVIEALVLDHGDAIYNKKLKSPAQLEKIVGKPTVSGLCEVPSNGFAMVPETDKRAGVLPAAIDFA